MSKSSKKRRNNFEDPNPQKKQKTDIIPKFTFIEGYCRQETLTNRKISQKQKANKHYKKHIQKAHEILNQQQFTIYLQLNKLFRGTDTKTYTQLLKKYKTISFEANGPIKRAIFDSGA